MRGEYKFVCASNQYDLTELIVVGFGGAEYSLLPDPENPDPDYQDVKKPYQGNPNQGKPDQGILTLSRK